LKPYMVNLIKAREAKKVQPPISVRAEELHRAARAYLLNEEAVA